MYIVEFMDVGSKIRMRQLKVVEPTVAKKLSLVPVFCLS